MKMFKRVQILALLFPVALVGAQAQSEKTISQNDIVTFEFPQPTGRYAVGTKVIELTDATRNDPETGKPRELVMQAWYPAVAVGYGEASPSSAFAKAMADKSPRYDQISPAEGTLGKANTPYAYEAIKSFTIGEDSKLVEELQKHNRICTHAIPDAAPCTSEEARFPVIIFGHGYGMSRGLYSGLCEDIASHGYVVAMVMHTYVTEVTRFADGREIILKDESMRERCPALFETCFADIECMINQAINGAFGTLTSVCDFSTMGIVGHSLGGMMASQVCRRDKRVKAGISLDGPLIGPDATIPYHKPFMFMVNPAFSEVVDEEFLTLIGMTREQFVRSIETFCKENGSTYKVLLKNAQHCTFADNAILACFFKKIFNTEDINLGAGTIDGFKATLIIRSYVCEFFDQHLKGQQSPLLTGKDNRFAADVDFTCWA